MIKRMRNLATTVRNFVALVRMIGPAWLLERASKRILPSRYVEIHRFLMIEHRAANLDFSEAGRPGMRWATPDDIGSSRSLGYAPELCRRLFERGARARVLEEDGRIIAFSWVESPTAGQGGIIFECEPGEIFHTLGFVVPDRRGQGIHKSVLLDGARELVHTHGYERFLFVIPNLNRSSRQVLKKFPGVSVLGTMFVLRLGNRYLIHDEAGVLIPVDGRGRGKHWITRQGEKPAFKVGLGEAASAASTPQAQPASTA